MSANLAIEMKNITMIFNKKIIANNKINLKVKKGEIHAIIGENGAGKSTLMSILFGMYTPTFGEIYINGQAQVITSPIKANNLGIGMVHQHFKLIDTYPFWKNISLGSEKTYFNIFVNKSETIKKISEIMIRYNLNIDLLKKPINSSVASQQKAEILKALYRDSDILIFDEPTAVLTPQEIEGFLEVLIALKKSGKTIIFITHKMAEIKKVADTATVLRNGEVVNSFNVADTDVEQFAQAMVGRKLKNIHNTYKEIRKDIVLKVENLSVLNQNNHKVEALKNFSLEVSKGEIVSIAGVEGNGQAELVNTITGLSKIKKGKIYVNNHLINKVSISKRYSKYRMSHIPEDRHKHGLVLDSDLINNMVLQDISSNKFSNFGFINFNAVQEYGQKIVEKYDVRNSQSGFAIARQLSGGNQQKAIVGRELERDSDLIIIFQPTRGLDIGSIEFIHSQIINAKNSGKAILLVSYELSEVLALSDRVVVLNSGNKVGELIGKEINIDKIGLMMMGEKV
ncbi:ABC transporter ATP-binding protein [Spiroplasma turonicum]|uniref:Ribose/galactose ABC transporter ATP-binding protein n=1 Tax=Spiroplasma turonicum TaxID=216946 RepID=A0A0K1P5N3_9MOLU|nr:ABC transporter ATP-binding protein [Spiroplasma turonicum]AKU79560.1 ribose/galactose ABC transporter ATP-binding protein [Spiroplasma turonicum]ALX70583.1 ribose/galactose ABC transporter ATP-binding protein [Spiroplasma turonicum]